uniref:Uncharacterized protein n=1 Tax=Ixodes ricinus TaxID=34613 RepID=A0A6B0UHE2_IXORI
MLVASQLRWGRWQTPAPLQVALQCEGPRKLRQGGVGSQRKQPHPRLLVTFASIRTTNRQRRDVRQHDAPTSVASFVATSGSIFTYGQDRTLNTSVGDALQKAYY